MCGDGRLQVTRASRAIGLLTEPTIQREDQPQVRQLRHFRSGLTSNGSVRRQRGRCAPAAGAVTQEMACCKAGHRTCGQMTSASDCCKSRQQTAPTVAVAKQTVSLWSSHSRRVCPRFSRSS